MEPVSPEKISGNLFDRIPIVSPLVRRIEALEFTDPQIPGDIKVDAQGRLLKSWIEYESILGSHIETFDNWVINIIPRQLASRPIRIPQGEVTVMNPIFFPPRISTSDSNWIPLTPQLARDNGYTYSSELYADFVLNAGTPQEERLPQSFLGKIPVMLGSVLCHLKGKTDKERMEMGECPSDPLGYFIIKGSEKIVLMQEKLRTDRIFLYHPSTKDAVVCKMTCSTVTGSTNVTIALGKKSKALKIHLAFMGRSKGKTNKIGNTVSVFQIYRMLGMKDPNQILQMISLFTKKEYIKKIWVQLQPTFVKLGQVGDDIEHISRKKGLGNMDYGIKQASIMKDLKNELFPQVPPENTTQKLYMLSIMVVRYAEYMIGERQLDDRDNWGNKRVENAARSLEQLFGNIWKESVLKAQDVIDTKGLQGLQSVKREINPSFIADNFVSSFNSNNWGVQGSYMPKENITDNLKRDSIAAVYSHLTKVNTPTNRRAKQAKVRMVQMSQLGYVCVTGDTEILLADHSVKQIKNLSEGDMIITVNQTTLKEEVSGFKNFFCVNPDKLLEITTITGRKIKCTPDHPFLVKFNDILDCNKWVNAGALRVGDNVFVRVDSEEEYEKYLKWFDKQSGCVFIDKLSFSSKYVEREGKMAIPIAEIKEIPVEPVYDFETLHDNHSFFANGYVTHNCMVETPEGEQCLQIDTSVLQADGSWLRIGDMNNNSDVTSVDPVTHLKSGSGIFNMFQYNTKDKGKKLFKITTVNGRTIKATEDHPFLTETGWKEVKSLSIGERVCVYTGIGPVLSNVEDKIILDEEIFRKNLTNVIKDSLIRKHLHVLKNRELLPLRSTSPLVPIIARMIGYTLADGSIGVYKQKPQFSEAFGQQRDAEEFESDAERLGFDRVKITYEEREIVDKKTGRVAVHHVYVTKRSNALASLFLALGMGPGKKTTHERKPVPPWIMEGSDLTKREFISGFQGGDGTAIQHCRRLDKAKAYAFTIGETVQHIIPKYSNSMFRFMSQMAMIIRQLGVDVTTVEIKKDPLPENTNLIGMYHISRSEANLIKYMDIIGYRYCATKFQKGLKVTEFLKYKQLMINTREELKKTVIDKYKSGKTIKQISVELNMNYRKTGSIIEYWREKGDNTNTLAPPETLTIKQFLEQNPVKDDYIYLKIDKIELIDHDYVADFTTVSSNHSFIANGFVTHNCGLVKNTAITAYMSIERGENVIIEHISKYISKLPTEQLPTPVMLNGKFMGWCAGASLRDFCVALRRRSIFYKDTAIVLARDGFLYIFSDAARPTRPLLIVDPENQELVIKNKDLWTADMKTLMDEGCVEYIDAYEQEYIQLAQMMSDIDTRNADLAEATRNHQEAVEKLSQAEQSGDRKTIEDAKEMVSQAANALKELQDIPAYTHCELDPTAILGIAASMVPLSNHNQGPRNVYQASMAKQALGIYHSQHAARFDTTSKCLAYPSRPLFQTQMDEIIGLNELPAGETVVVAIMTYTGYNQEDALIMNQAAIDRGLFRQVIYKSYKTVQKRTRTTVEEFGRPQVRKDEPPERYAAIDDNGIAKLGSFVREGDCLIGKIRKNITTGKVENASSYVGVGQEGIVDRVLVSTNPEGMRVVKVKLRQIRKPIMGDKFASRYAQKATLGLILPQEDMPFTASGMVPDLIINPHSIPSRMTIGKVIEIVTSKIAAFSGERVNATAFRKFDVKTFTENLVQYGYSPSGKERLFSGFTGKPLEAMIFTGPCFYQVLRHHVLDKIQMRAKGAIKQLSHQPVGGRARKGGQRFGEMERDAIISHGASAFLRERLCTVSDAYQAVYCSKCGSIAIANHTSDKFVCRTCNEGATFGTCTIPYAYKLLTHMLAGAGFNLQFDMSVENSNERPVIPLGENGPSINAAGVCTPRSVNK